MGGKVSTIITFLFVGTDTYKELTNDYETEYVVDFIFRREMLAGAAVGAGIVTACVAITDAKSGESRSWTQFLGDLITGAGMGAVAGATIYGLWTALPIVGQAAGIQASIWLRGVTKFTAITIPKIFAGVGYGLIGTQGVRYLNELTSIGSGQNWILEHIFGGNEGNYTTANMCLDLLSMGYLQIAADNVGLAKNKTKKEKKNSDNSSRSGFDFDGNEVPYVSDYFDIENIEQIEDARMYGQSTFYEVNVNGKKIYVSTGLIRQSQFGNIVDKIEGKVSILSGVHGDVSGNILLEYNGLKGETLLNEDILRWGNANNITIYNVSELSAIEVSSIINSSDHTFLAGVLVNVLN